MTPSSGGSLSIDPVDFMESGYNPGMFNRYAYVFNDPVNGADSTGMICDTGICGSVRTFIRNEVFPGPDNAQELVQKFGQPVSDIGQTMSDGTQSISGVEMEAVGALTAALGNGGIGRNSTISSSQSKQGALRPASREPTPTTTVGRWMSPAEAAKMQKTNTVQESTSGLTHVANPASASTFGRQAPSGSVYAEFNVPSSSLRPSGTGVSSIPGPNARIRPAPSMPTASNIRILDNKP